MCRAVYYCTAETGLAGATVRRNSVAAKVTRWREIRSGGEWALRAAGMPCPGRGGPPLGTAWVEGEGGGDLRYS